MTHTRTIWDEGREPGSRVVALGVALALTVAVVDSVVAGRIELLFERRRLGGTASGRIQPHQEVGVVLVGTQERGLGVRQPAGALVGAKPAQRFGATLDVGEVFAIQHEKACRGVTGTGVDPVALVAAFRGAVEAEAEAAESVLLLHARAGPAQVEKEEPQPQVVLAFGLRITNCEPERFSA